MEVEGPFQAHEPRAVVETQIPNEGTETYEAARSHNILSGCLSTSPMWHLSKYMAFYNVALRQHKKNKNNQMNQICGYWFVRIDP